MGDDEENYFFGESLLDMYTWDLSGSHTTGRDEDGGGSNVNQTPPSK